MLRRVREVVVAADDVRDPHLDVVDADAEMVERVAVRADEDEIVEGVRRELDRPSDPVVDHDRLRRHLQADDVALSGARAAVALVRGDVAAGSRVAVRAPLRLRFLALEVQLLRRLEGAVGASFRDELPGGGAVELGPVRLVERALVVVEPQPLHGGKDLRRELLPGALDVRVLDAEDERSLLAPREEEVVERRPGAADVQRAGGGRRETDAGSGRIFRQAAGS